MSSKDEETFDALASELESSFGDPEEVEAKEEETPDTTEGEETAEEETKTEDDEKSTEEDATEEEAPEPEPVDKDEPVERPSSKEDIKAALRELEAERQNSLNVRTTLRDEVRQKMFPQGVETPITDSEGRVINGPADLVDKVVDPDTGEAFTREGAEKWWADTKAEQDKAIESLEQDIDRIAETNQNLADEYKYVAAKYGAWLEANPQVAERVGKLWEKTLEKDPNTNIVIKAPIGLAEHYDGMLSPYMQLSQQDTAKQREAEERAEREKAKQNMADRSDLSPTAGDPKGKKDQLDKAFEAYFN